MFSLQLIKKHACPQPPPLAHLNYLVTRNLQKALELPSLVPDTPAW
jgi:hypothetical protein